MNTQQPYASRSTQIDFAALAGMTWGMDGRAVRRIMRLSARWRLGIDGERTSLLDAINAAVPPGVRVAFGEEIEMDGVVVP